MNHLPKLAFARSARRAIAPIFLFAILTLSSFGAAAEDESGWSINLTPVLILAHDGNRFGGGADPELKYTLDLGAARLSAGARVGTYYAKNLFGVTVMPTWRLMVPVGPLEPYVAFGMGYGWLPRLGHQDIATMSRVGLVYRFSAHFAVGLEATFQEIENTAFRFPSFGSMASFDL
ncbi:MAG: hypothetical protein JWN48_2150 [Myxococcaceae bacterium]|nr:hypothetical protein [Myxococcaceae bacterium]